VIVILASTKLLLAESCDQPVGPTSSSGTLSRLAADFVREFCRWVSGFLFLLEELTK
jgi:hypothetical protein